MPADTPSPSIEALLAHAAWVRGLAARLLRDPAAVDDVVQGAWLAALEHPPRHDANLRAWLGRVVTNLVRQRGRGEARRSAREQAVAERDPAERLSPDELVERVELERRLAARVLELEEPLRETVLLRFHEDLPSAEIARRTGVPAGTVRWRLKRALDHLREQLDEEHGSRRAWCLALIPLARRAPRKELATAGGGAGLTTLLQGVLSMHLALKIPLALAAAAALVFLSPLRSLLPVRSPLALERLDPELVSYRSLEEASTLPTPEAAEKTLATRQPLTSEETTSPEGPSVRGQVVDASGAPIAGARVVPARNAAEQKTGPDGSFACVLPARRIEEGRELSLLVDAPGFLLDSTRWTPVADHVVELGAIVLERAGGVEGRVLDAAGVPVEGAFVSDADLERDAGSLRRIALRLSLDPEWVASSNLSSQPAVRTDSEGRFRLTRVRPGARLLWAARAGSLGGHSGIVDVRAGQLASGVELTLGELDPSTILRGQVVDPDGRPVALARIETSYHSWFRSGSGTLITDEQGRFALPYEPAIPRALRASDGAGRWRDVAVEGAVGGEDLILQLRPPVFVRVHARGPRGALEGADVTVWNEDRTGLLVQLAGVAREGDESRFLLPAESFLVEVSAPGFAAEELGPFEPESAPLALEARLRPLPGVRGRVTCPRGPVAGARVVLTKAAREDGTINGFPVRVQAWGELRGETDPDGRFDLTLREDGTFYLRVEAEGWAPKELGPLALTAAAGRAGLDVELDRGGVLEGLVLDSDGAPAPGAIVAVSRGDGHARSVRAGSDGTYRIELLTPGPWRVERRDEPISPNRTSSAQSGRAFDPEKLRFDCVVRAGEVTRFDLGATGGRPRLLGSLRLDGEGASGARVFLLDEGGLDVRARGVQRGVALDADGAFTLTVPDPGDYRLRFELEPERADVAQVLLVDVQVGPGDNPWSLALRTGGLEVGGVQPAPDPDRSALVLWSQGDGTQLLARLLPKEGQDVVSVRHVPEGRGYLRRFNLRDLAGLSGLPAPDEETVTFDVRAGASTSVRAPR